MRRVVTGRAVPTRRARNRSDAGFDLVIGNPPFLGQLLSATAMPRRAAALVRARTSGMTAGYGDAAGAFLALGLSLVRPGGRVAMIQPQSVLAARDSAALRRGLLARADLVAIWLSEGRAFEGAGAHTCALTFERHGVGTGVRGAEGAREAEGGGEAGGGAARVARWVGLPPRALASAPAVGRGVEGEGGGTWARFVAAARGVPEVSIGLGCGVLGEIARATADFRDEYYALRGLVVEGGVGGGVGECAGRVPVVTSGLIDVAWCAWGARGARIHGVSWSAPMIDTARAPAGVRAWLRARLVPKVLVATQTRVIEAVADDGGVLAPITPVVSVIPVRSEDVWRVAAVLSAPVCAAVALSRHGGTGLSPDAIRLRARDALDLPLPGDVDAWEEGARRIRLAHERPSERVEWVGRCGEAMCEAYGVGGARARELMGWWLGRVAGSGVGA